MAITTGDAYVDTTVAGPGTGTIGDPCKSLKYLLTVANGVIGTLTGDLVVHCHGTLDLTTSGIITLTGLTSLAPSYKLTVKGEWPSTVGAFDTSLYYYKTSVDNHFFSITELNLAFENMQFEFPSVGNNDYIMNLLAVGSVQTTTFKNCIFRHTGAANTTVAGIRVAVTTGSTINVINCIFLDWAGTTNSGITCNADMTSAYNCTFYNCTTAANDTTGGALLVKNCVFNSNAADQGTHEWKLTSDYNSTDRSDATWPPNGPAGANNVKSVADFNFFSVGTEDFRPTATSGITDFRNSGVTIAGTPNPSPDPFGTIRPSETNWTRGAFEYILPAGVTFTEHRHTLLKF